ncbi:hypothetical protein Clacol_009123 [Clathrus columnatus]|uniref:G-protein coupled receptors family 2 profile 2 domain-containing protein n=1 Tax=Clathrus columnatus TaxID=1419009 RepID=A0AAV5APV7_9AGAM|nr:hypothetical protein Clacol_009123 [Clathrus columnatus]
MAAFGLSGWCCSFSIATALAVLRPRAFSDASAALSWHPRYIPTLIIYPICASAIYAVVVIKLDAVRPVSSDDLHCDVTDPVWVRLLGYGGVSPGLSIPFLILSIMSAKKLYTLRYESEHRSTDPGLVTTQQSFAQQSFEMLETGPRSNRLILQQYEPEKPKRTVSRKNMPSSIVLNRGTKVVDRARSDSPGSDTMPVFIPNNLSRDYKASIQPLEVHVEKSIVLTTEEAPRPRTAQSNVIRGFSPTQGSLHDTSVSPQRQALESLTRYETSPPVESPSALDIVFSPTPASSTKLLFSPNAPRASQIIDFDALYSEKNEVDKVTSWEDNEYYENDYPISSLDGQPGTTFNKKKRRISEGAAKQVSVSTANQPRNVNPHKLTGAYRRMVLLQIGYFLVQLLAALSTIIDVATNRLTPFGTQHCALILAGWGPYIVYVGVRLISRWITI